jgi:hypothetical protein
MHQPHGETPGGNPLTAHSQHKDPLMGADPVDKLLNFGEILPFKDLPVFLQNRFV